MRRTAARLLVLFGLLLGLARASGAAQEVHLPAWTGGPTPSLALKDPDGRLHDLADYRGKVLLGNAQRAWGVRGLPATFLLDREGAIRYWYLGELDWARPEILRTVESLFPAAR